MGPHPPPLWEILDPALHFYIPNDKNWTVDVKFYHLLQTAAHKQLTTEDCSLSP